MIGNENFPYTNFHDLNMDWIIKIAKDFLDQYTHLQEMIENGEAALDAKTAEGIAALGDKADELETLLQEWYDSHSHLIAQELAQALRDIQAELATSETDFSTFAQGIASALIPPDNLLLSHTWDQATGNESSYALMDGYWTASLTWHDTDSDHQYRACDRFPVTVGDIVSFSAPNAWGYNFFDSNRNIIAMVRTDANDPVDIYITDPAYKYCSITLSTANYNLGYLKVYVENQNRIFGEARRYSSPILANGYWTNSGNFRTLTPDTYWQSTHRIPIMPGAVLELLNVPTGYIHLWQDQATILEAVAINQMSSPEYTVTNPNARYFSILSRRTEVTSPVNLIIKNEIIRTPIYAELAENVLQVRTHYTSGKDLIVRFEIKGHNNLPDFSRLLTSPNNGKYPMPNMDNLTDLLSIGTDWHAPFVIESFNPTGDRVTDVTYTGGNHSYDTTDPASTPTARNSSLKFWINDAASVAYKGYCNNIRIEWYNQVQAYNTVRADGTGREVLEEHHILTFDGSVWTSVVDLKPLEAIRMRKYYGWAMSGLASIYPQFQFIGGTERAVLTPAQPHENADHRNCEILAYSNTDLLSLKLDLIYDLGDRRMCQNADQIVHSQENKAYHMLIENQDMVASRHYWARAWYQFKCN